MKRVPLALCIEDVDRESFTRCVALPGRRAGLGLDDDGGLSWLTKEQPAVELWVSKDGRLVAFRPRGAVASTLARGGRRLALPEEKPVFLLDKDLQKLAGRTLRVHEHGPAGLVQGPAPVRARHRKRLLSAAATKFVAATSIAVRCSPPDTGDTGDPCLMPDGSQDFGVVVLDEPVPVKLFSIRNSCNESVAEGSAYRWDEQAPNKNRRFSRQFEELPQRCFRAAYAALRRSSSGEDGGERRCPPRMGGEESVFPPRKWRRLFPPTLSAEMVGADEHNGDGDAFVVKVALPAEIPAGEELKVAVAFQPREAGEFFALLKFENDLGRDVGVSLWGTAVEAR